MNEQKIYLSPILDLYNQEIVAYEVAKNAWAPKSPISEKLTDNGIKQSMSRKGSCLDNAVAENFFGLLKSKMYHGDHFQDADKLIDKIDEYIEYYNTKRIKAKLKGLTPIKYRNQALQAAN